MIYQNFFNCRLILLFFLSAWLSIAAINNMTDSSTNISLVTNTLTMSLLQSSSEFLGQGLLWRALPRDWVAYIYYGIVLAQISIAFLLWNSWFRYVFAYYKKDQVLVDRAVKRVITALTCFLTLWLAFICGGLWFGYWLKQGAMQSVHMTLILIALLSIMLFEREVRIELQN